MGFTIWKVDADYKEVSPGSDVVGCSAACQLAGEALLIADSWKKDQKLCNVQIKAVRYGC